jgi:hypothetical protein
MNMTDGLGYFRGALAGGLVLGLLLAGPAFADIAKNGTVAARATDATTAKALELGNDRTLYVLDSVLVVQGDDPNGLLHNMTGQCYALEEVVNGTGAGMATGHCTYTDGDGDKIFETLKLGRASGKDEASGKSTLTGGTGKFQGISGEVTHTRRLLASPAEGVYPGVGRLSGSYSIK